VHWQNNTGKKPCTAAGCTGNTHETAVQATSRTIPYGLRCRSCCRVNCHAAHTHACQGHAHTHTHTHLLATPGVPRPHNGVDAPCTRCHPSPVQLPSAITQTHTRTHVRRLTTASEGQHQLAPCSCHHHTLSTSMRHRSQHTVQRHKSVSLDFKPFEPLETWVLHALLPTATHYPAEPPSPTHATHGHTPSSMLRCAVADCACAGSSTEPHTAHIQQRTHSAHKSKHTPPPHKPMHASSHAHRTTQVHACQ
jgi:hypothetical protein